MQIDRNPIDELTARLTVTVEPADYESRVEKILNDYRKNSTYPGFRKERRPWPSSGSNTPTGPRR